MSPARGGISPESRDLRPGHSGPRALGPSGAGAVGPSGPQAVGRMPFGISGLPSPVQLGDGSEQVPGVGVLRLAENLFCVAHLDHGAVAEDDGTVADVVA